MRDLSEGVGRFDEEDAVRRPLLVLKGRVLERFRQSTGKRPHLAVAKSDSLGW